MHLPAVPRLFTCTSVIDEELEEMIRTIKAAEYRGGGGDGL